MYGSVLPSRLTSFGYRLLGPFLLDWYNRLRTRTADIATDTVFVLGREGWNLVPLFNTIDALHLGPVRRRYIYLQASRALLTHIGLSDPELFNLGLESRYKGTIGQFLESRLCVPAELLSLPAAINQGIELPRDRSYLAPMIEQRRDVITALAGRSRIAYGRYLDRIGLSTGGTHILTDLGFRGMTQALIARLYGQHIVGCYALLDPSGVPAPLALPLGSARGLFSDDKRFGEDFEPIDSSLLLEMMLTAPVGQTAGIQSTEQGDPFLYRPPNSAQVNFGVITEAMQGVYKFIHDNADLIGISDPLIENFTAFFRVYKDEIRQDIDIFSPILEIDDSYFGNQIFSAKNKL